MDTALALGALTLVAPSGATRLRVFLLTLVVIDDLGALLIIAVVYTRHVSLFALTVELVLFAVLVSLRLAGRWRTPVAVVVGVGRHGETPANTRGVTDMMMKCKGWLIGVYDITVLSY